MNSQIPHDPQILVSYVNTELRDHYTNLEDLCKGLELDQTQLVKTLGAIEYFYSSAQNRFI